MPSREKIAQALQGFSEGVAGRGAQFIKGLDADRQQALLQDAFSVQGKINNNDLAGARDILQDRVDTIAQLGGDDTDTLGVLRKLEAGDVQGALSDVSTVVEFGREQGLLKGDLRTAKQREFEDMSAEFSPEDVTQARRIQAGLDPRAVGSSAATIAATPGQTDEVARSEAIIAGQRAGAVEGAQLTAQLQLEPQVSLAVQNAISNATANAEATAQNRNNTTALELYDVAMKGVSEAFGNVHAGPIIGLMPAMTANAQIADGAVAAMAPVLKQLFRAAGEGVFTDKDQELLLGMIPSRQTLPEARGPLLENIDAIVRVKLGQVPGSAVTPSQTFTFNPQTGQIE